ncbi:ATP-binding protein [bacterium]|nr:ATP-binding protein [bacterium]
MYVHRTIESFFLKASSQFPVMLVTGARQVGKTTLLQKLTDFNRTYVTLDDPIIRNLAVQDPALFMQRFTPPLLIDEIQYAPELLPYIKMKVDNDRCSGQYWLTGSQQFHVMKNVSETLAGRVGIIQLYGFSKWESQNKGKKSKPFLTTPDFIAEMQSDYQPLPLKNLYQMIWRGSMPMVMLDTEMDKNLFYSSYVQTYLKRDIHDLTQVADELAFIRFIRACAARSGQLLNMVELAKDTGVSPNTVKHWLSILVATSIVYLLEPYHTNVTKRLIKTPKLYFLDTGLCSWLTEWTSSETLEAGAFSGAILETWVISELLKSYCHNGRQAPFYYYRDKDKKEIDLLIVLDGEIYPIEIKKTASPCLRDIRQFKTLERLKMPVGSGGLICFTDQIIPLTSSVNAIPVGCI